MKTRRGTQRPALFFALMVCPWASLALGQAYNPLHSVRRPMPSDHDPHRAYVSDHCLIWIYANVAEDLQVRKHLKITEKERLLMIEDLAEPNATVNKWGKVQYRLDFEPGNLPTYLNPKLLRLRKLMGKERLQRLLQLAWQKRFHDGGKNGHSIFNDPNFQRTLGITSPQRRRYRKLCQLFHDFQQGKHSNERAVCQEAFNRQFNRLLTAKQQQKLKSFHGPTVDGKQPQEITLHFVCLPNAQ